MTVLSKNLNQVLSNLLLLKGVFPFFVGIEGNLTRPTASKIDFLHCVANLAFLLSFKYLATKKRSGVKLMQSN